MSHTLNTQLQSSQQTLPALSDNDIKANVPLAGQSKSETLNGGQHEGAGADSRFSSSTTVFDYDDPWALGDVCNQFSVKGKALQKAVEQNMEDICHFHDLRVAHIHKIYDKKGGLILNEGPTLGMALKKRDEDIYHHLDRIEKKKQKLETEMLHLALDQDCFDNKYVFYGERLQDVVKNASYLHKKLCRCFMKKSDKKYECKVCDIPAHILTTVTKPDHVTKVGSMYLVAFNSARLLQLCGRQGLKCNLSWTEAAAIAWFGSFDTFGHDKPQKFIDDIVYDIPLSKNKKLAINGLTQSYRLVDAGTRVTFDLESRAIVARLHRKCRQFGREVCAVMSGPSYFLPDNFIQHQETY